MAQFKVIWESADGETHEITIDNVPSMAHAAWRAAELVYDCVLPEGRRLLDVIRLA